MESCPQCWVDYFQAFAPVIIGICVAWVAYSQWRTAELKRKQDLFDKRFEVYRAIMKLIKSGADYDKAEDSEIDRMVWSHLADGLGYFLFGKEIEEYLRELYGKRLKRAQCANDVDNLLRRGDSDKILLEEDKELREYFFAQSKIVKERFAKYLSIP